MQKIDVNRKFGRFRVIVTGREHYPNNGRGCQWLKAALHPMRLCLSVNVLYGKGAGYIGGRTAFLTYGCRTMTPNGWRLAGLRLGFTGNANAVPLPRYGW